MAGLIAQKTLRDSFQETEDAISSGRVDTALANCQSFLASFPESLEAQRLLGEVYLAQGRLEEALHAFDWVLTNDPENVLAYCNRAMVSERMSDVDTALDCYQQAYELSRGNGQIREEFTKLSARVGQQGFVFSRAGLARLYVRGDLLSQAVQEWEAVLTATPERLDARTGLLETYWREGSLDHVEELATQILQGVPGCVKALLLLAHVTASKDMARAQALLRQVEALDPDLVMAQELFADMLAHSPDDPFLKLLKKAPCVLNASPTSNIAPQAASIPSAAVSLQGGLVPILETSAADPAGTSLPWEDSQGWGKDAAFLSPFSGGELQQNNSAPWAMDHTINAMTDNDASNGDRGRQAITSGLEPSDPAVQLSSDITPMGSWTMPEEFLSSVPSQESQPEPWEMLQSALQNAPSAPPPQESQPEPWEMLQSALQNAPSALPQESQPEPWEMLQSALHNMPGSITDQDQEQSGHRQWEDQGAVSHLDGGGERWESQEVDTVAEPDPGSNDSWVSPAGDHGTEGGDWTLATQENDPPSWLSMLTQADRKQMTSGMAPLEQTSPSSIEPEETLSSLPQEPVTHQPMTSLDSSPWAQELQPASSLGNVDVDDNDDEESSFGPAWLRSLGAATLEDEDAPHLEQSAPVVSPLSTESEKQELPDALALHNAFEEADLQEQPAAHDPWKISESGARSSSAYDPWWPPVSEPEKQPTVEPDLQVPLAILESHQAFDAKSEPEVVANSAEKVEQNLVATLEELEQQLRAKGFVAMEPKSLSAIAQAEEVKPADTAIPLSTQQTSQPVQETSQKQALPSALTELGMMFHESVGEAKPPVSSASSTANAADFPAEPLWLQALRSSSISELDASTAGPAFNTPIVTRPVPPAKVSQELPNTPPVPVESISGLIFEPTPISAASSSISELAGALNGQDAGTNPFLETELETTMKRPAVRLQSMVHSIAPHDNSSSSGKVHTRERGESPVAKIAEGDNLNYKERLLKGYQHQLVGDYDEAMQDYRLVIRGAPELLGEVISNLRALLKLAPKYPAGCRVLGDAYMRQGEYLQAMEAYNSALTMAKKARS
ncbi:MAG TPA: tetratricopeptide repeat protein [Ktedonobacteraceae bacterium]|jgi:tetratricopeptide (TPR) repeat protein